MHDPWHQSIPPAAGFFGAILMMTFRGQMPTHMWLVAIGAGVLLSYFGVPVAMSYLRYTVEWLPQDGSVDGLLGCLFGLGSIYFVGAVATLGKRIEANPLDPRSLK